jgi:imidazoleglycerol-phosphate dehydratase/histidinol-phosphatase
LTQYFTEEYDLANSYVIGDRFTDVQLAKNLGSKAIFIGDTNLEAELSTKDWDEIYNFLKMPPRQAEVKRTTSETDIYIKLNLDGSGKCDISTGLHFFDHMLEQLGKHGSTDLEIKVKGDLHIDEHHTIEDTALALGEAYLKALGDKKGIYRYGFMLPMDDALAQVAIDFGGRPWIVWDAKYTREKVGDMPTELFYHFFKSFSDTSKCNLNIKVEGDNEHHKIEASFKGLARAIKMAVMRDPRTINQLPSTKGVL